ncbi:Component of oligomeric Golgi complex 4 (Conserved oligomeric Golgi complex subunit 4), partial [Durusdinium trenchii]
TPDPTIPEDVEVESEEEESPVVEEQGRSRDLIVEGDNQDFNSASPKMKALILEAMRGEWGKFEHYSAAVLISGPDLEKLLRQGHTIIPSKWVLVDKHEYLKGKKEYTPKIKA